MSVLDENEWHRIGKHSLCFEVPDIVHLRVVGDLSIEHIRQVLAFPDAFPKPETGFFSLIDIAEAGRPNLEVLRSNEHLKKMQNYRAMVYYRALFQHRTVIEIVQKISRALDLSIQTTPLVAFATEVEARAWIVDHRQRSV